MGSVNQKPTRGGKPRKGVLPKWEIVWTNEDGVRRKKTIQCDRREADRQLAELEAEARDIKNGLITRSKSDQYKAAAIPLATHVADYRQSLADKKRSAKHCSHVASTLTRLFASAAVRSLADLGTSRIASVIGRIGDEQSARTANHARGCIKAFARWMMINGRIEAVPLPIMALEPYNEKADPKWVRRAITKEELDKLLRTTEGSEPLRLSRIGYQYEESFLSGPERATLYRLAMGTGFRAKEIRTLTPERFQLDGDEPTITVVAAYAKNGKTAVQPITPELADELRPFLKGKPPGHPVLPFPKKAANMLKKDLARAGIPYKDAEGCVLDFHALRASYVTHLILSGANPKVVQALARHSTISLTLDRYTKLGADDARNALKGLGNP